MSGSETGRKGGFAIGVIGGAVDADDPAEALRLPGGQGDGGVLAGKKRGSREGRGNTRQTGVAFHNNDGC